jgi:signal transduction histidine kinase
MRKPKSDLVPVLLVGATLTALLVLAVYLVNRETSVGTGEAARTAILSESTLGAAAAVRNATNFAVILDLNDASDTLVSDARHGANNAAQEMQSRFDALIAEIPAAEARDVTSSFEAYEAATQAALEAIGSGIVTASDAIAAQREAYEGLSSGLARIRDSRTAQIALAGEGVGRAANAVRFLVVFLLPFGIMVGVWRAVRRTSDRRILEEELRSEREVSQSKDSFVADVSHELRTPLTGIYGFALALEDGDDLNPPEKELVGLIVTEAAELSRMVDDLVAAGRIEADAISYNLGPVELASEIEEVIRPFKRRGISVEVDNVGLSVRADRLRLRQLLRNLVSNAAKYGGTDIAVTAYTVGDRVVIEVIDDGPGVSAEVEDRMFTRYVHDGGSAVLQGSVGLGLAIARTFAEGMDGSLEYKRINDLTIFEVTLPSADPEPAIEEPQELAAPATTASVLSRR